MSKDRDDYDWDDAASDLAYSTPLTIRTAGRVSQVIAGTGIHPFDALPLLVEVFADDSSPTAQAHAIARLIGARTD